MSYDNKPRPPTPGWPNHDPNCKGPVDHKGYCVPKEKK